MSRHVRAPMLRGRLRRGLLRAACGAAMLLSASSAFAQSGMCTGTSTGTSTGTTTGSTGTVSLSRSGGTATSGTSAANALAALQAVQMAHQFQINQQQAYQAQARQMMQLMQYEADLMAQEQQQLDQQRAHRLANSQRRKALQAARVKERRTRTQSTARIQNS